MPLPYGSGAASMCSLCRVTLEYIYIFSSSTCVCRAHVCIVCVRVRVHVNELRVVDRLSSAFVVIISSCVLCIRLQVCLYMYLCAEHMHIRADRKVCMWCVYIYIFIYLFFRSLIRAGVHWYICLWCWSWELFGVPLCYCCCCFNSLCSRSLVARMCVYAWVYFVIKYYGPCTSVYYHTPTHTHNSSGSISGAVVVVVLEFVCDIVAVILLLLLLLLLFLSRVLALCVYASLFFFFFVSLSFSLFDLNRIHFFLFWVCFPL